jgi:hypothetical protein
VLKQGRYSHYRQYQNRESDVDAEDFDDFFFSEWISLTGGQLYYVEAGLGQGGGLVSITVGFEVNPTTPIPDHPMQST